MTPPSPGNTRQTGSPAARSPSSRTTRSKTARQGGGGAQGLRGSQPWASTTHSVPDGTRLTGRE